jgi:hypothetical protein
MSYRSNCTTIRSARRLAQPVTRLALVLYARGLDAPVLAALSGVAPPVLAEMIAGGPAAADMDMGPYLDVAAALGLPVAVLCSDVCPQCVSPARSLDGVCLACGVSA